MVENNDGNKIRIIIPQSWSGEKLEAFLRREMQLSRTGIRALKRQDGILLNGKLTFVTYRLIGGELLEITLPQTAEQDFAAENLPLKIIYEDFDIIIIDKAAGMVVHPTKGYLNGTLANALKYYWQTQGDSATFHPLHRLDRSTSGLILIAKNSWAHQQLDRQLMSGKVHRLYLAYCCNLPPCCSGKIDLPIESLPTTSKRRISSDGKPAQTRYRVLKRFREHSLLAVKLYTGRTHQIRVHLAHCGFPLYGDWLYGVELPDFPFPALHSAKLSFYHPRNGKFMSFKSTPERTFAEV